MTRAGFRGHIILCAYCRLDVEGCQGRDVDWMHTQTRSEFCVDGRPATPEWSDQVDSEKQKDRRRNR